MLDPVCSQQNDIDRPTAAQAAHQTEKLCLLQLFTQTYGQQQVKY